jgi:tRNA threonylcarbamoyladenosine biosynthesis protein TsaE
LWPALPQSCVVYLLGELGAGKTSLVRGLLREAGYDKTVRSPTYSLVEEYAIGHRLLFHFDLYRLKSADELLEMGIEDYFQQNALCLIEWPQMGEGQLPPADVIIQLSHQADGRSMVLSLSEILSKSDLKLVWKNNNLLL